MNFKIDENVITEEEKAILTLRHLYIKNGYRPFKMKKFEEYELYSTNKDFLPGNGIISFNDTNGKLLALKPDVTLSIIKNGNDKAECNEKVCYNENVYRVSGTTNRFREIMQTGIENIGNIRLTDIAEVITLAAETLEIIDGNFIIDISNLDLLSETVCASSDNEDFRKSVYELISKKNSHDLNKLCREYSVSEKNIEALELLVSSSGNRNTVLKAIEKVSRGAELKKMKELSEMLDKTRFSDKILFDFSVINNLNYYNGFVFKGFINNVFDGVLSGGQYNKMMERINRKSGAIGFALYLDLFEKLSIKGGSEC